MELWLVLSLPALKFLQADFLKVIRNGHLFYFFNSKKFISFYENLPKDFKNDIATFEEIRKIQLLTVSSQELHNFFNKILKKDYVWYK